MRARFIAVAFMATGLVLTVRPAASLQLDTITLTPTVTGFTLVTEGQTWEDLQIGYTLTVTPEQGTPAVVSGTFPINNPEDIIDGHEAFRKSFSRSWGFTPSGGSTITGRIELQHLDGSIVDWYCNPQYKEIDPPIVLDVFLFCSDATAPRTWDGKIVCAPNPFNPNTTISFTLTRQERVTAKIYTSVGTEVATITDRTFPAGSHTVDWTARNLASGIYFCRIQAGKTVSAAKLLLMK